MKWQIKICKNKKDKEMEKEAGITIFHRSRTGITLTKDGAEFLGYARQVIQQMELLEDRYVTNLPRKVIEGLLSTSCLD